MTLKQWMARVLWNCCERLHLQLPASISGRVFRAAIGDDNAVAEAIANGAHVFKTDLRLIAPEPETDYSPTNSDEIGDVPDELAAFNHYRARFGNKL